MRITALLLFLALPADALAIDAGPEEAIADVRPVSFRRQVIAVLTQAGCNAGACHGTPSGKDGFRLSLRGYLPEVD